jgi:glycosyltransferase involved in cell wall biosynthesis
VRIALINEGTYPYGAGPVSTWCHRLVRGLAEHTFWLVGVVDRAPAPSYAVPPNVAGLSAVLRGGPPIGPDRPVEARQHGRLATHAAVLLCRGMFDDSPHSAAMFRSGLRRLAGLAADGTHPLAGVPLAAVLLDAWRATVDPSLPPPTIGDAEQAAALLELAVRPLAAPVPEVDVCHAVHSGGSVLVALAGKWRDGVPYVLTEHDVYLAGSVDGPPAVRAVLLRFLRALTRLGYAEAAAIAPPDERMRRWALHHGADRGLVTLIPPGVDPNDHPPLREEPAGPVLAWLGEPAALPGMLHAFGLVRGSVPDARLIVIGSALDGVRAPEGVSFSGPVTGYRGLFAKATVLVISGAHDGMPYPLIEAMLAGRATVCTENGGLAATVGIGASVVPPEDPVRLAAACVDLLTDERLRREIGTMARNRARTLFRLGAMLDGYRELYEKALVSRPEPVERVVSAP